MGYDFLITAEHVLGANPHRPNWNEQWFDVRDQFHEPFVLLSHLAAVTERIKLVTGIIILPQRQTALVAKQAAEVDILSNGRLRLGVGVGGPYDIEYVSLGQSFHNRGMRIEEQIHVLRLLWQNEHVIFDGHWHHIPDVGINPRPFQQPIPIWMGGSADIVLRRAANIADGWIADRQPISDLKEQALRLIAYTREAGRDLREISIVGRVSPGSLNSSQWIEEIYEWQEIGATHVFIVTSALTFDSPGDQVQIIRNLGEKLAGSGISF